MRDGLRSRDLSGQLEGKDDVLLSSLIRKKKKGKKSSGGAGKKLIFESKKVKKRLRLTSSDTDSDNELLVSASGKVGRRNDGDGGDSVVIGFEKSSIDSRKRKRKSGVEKKSRPVTVKYSEKAEISEDEDEQDENDGDGSDSIVVEKSNVGSRKRKRKSGVEKRSRLETVKYNEEAEISEDEAEPNIRSRLEIFEYNEDDLVDYKKMKKETEKERSRGVGTDKRKRSKADKKKSLLAEKNSGVDLSDEDKCEIEEDKTIRSAGTSKKKSKVSRKNRIRGKGENGDSPVLAEKRKKVDRPEKTFDHSEAGENRSSRSAGSSIGKKPQSSIKSKKSLAIPSPPAIREKKTSPKRLSSKKNKQGDEKEERNKGETTSASKLPKHNTLSAAKQLIRDQLKRLIESAGWTIDYRPRRDKEYNDAVYIDHAGRTYWSVLKAYYALQKQWKNKESSEDHYPTGFSFTPVPEEVLDKLTRLTKRRMERENIIIPDAEKGSRKAKGASAKKPVGKKIGKKSKGRSMSREKLNTHNRQGRKSLKAGLKKDFNLNRKNGVKRPTSAHNSDKVGNGKHNGMPKSPNAHLLQGRKNKTRRGYTLLVRESNKEVNSDGDHFIAYTEKRTVLSWLIDSEIVSIGGKVKYMNKRCSRALLEGCITRDGINCGCCNEIVTISEFETHAGSKLRQPCQNIFVETGVPLFQCQIDAWNKQEESERNGYRCIDISSDDPNDDTCGICGDGGDLICCDGCPSTFHQSCLGIQVLPMGDWHCFNCCCKFCGIVGCSNGQGDDATISRLLTCSLCEEKYHGSCILQRNVGPVDSDSLCASFCGQTCRELFEQLQKLLGVKHELEAGFSWTLIQRFDLESDTSLCGLPQKVECNSKLALALSVMDECFLPTIDERTGISLIHNVVYNCGSNFNRLNYSGFYTFILERHDEIICAATIRIHGNRFAEMPFIGTRHIYRRQGMCRRLLNAIESALSSLNVEKLIIPAISELMDTWTIVFGFSPLEESYKHEVRSLNMVVFPGVDLLQKLVKHNSAEVALTDGSVLKPVELAKTSLQADGGLVEETSDSSTSQSQNESISETDSVLPEAEENPTMNCSVKPDAESEHSKTSYVKSSSHNSLEGAVNDVQEVSIVINGVESDLRAAPHKTNVLHECLDMHPRKEETECYNSQSRNESSIRVVESEPAENTHVGSSGHDSIEGAVNHVQDLNMVVDGVEPDLQSLAETSAQCITGVLHASPNNSKFNSDSSHQNTGGMENKSLEDSPIESDMTHSEETTGCASDEVIKPCEVKTAFENKVSLHHSTDTVTELHVTALVLNFQDPGTNGICDDSEGKQTSKTVFKCNLQESSESRGSQLLNGVDTLCKLENEVAASEGEVSLDRNNHVPHDSLNTAKEPIIRISSGSTCTSELLRKVPGSLCCTPEKVTSTSKFVRTHSVDLNRPAFGEDEVDFVETDDTTFEEDSVRETSEVTVKT